MSHERDVFVREPWPADQVRRDLDDHLAHTAKAGEAMLLADRLLGGLRRRHLLQALRS